MRVCGECCGLWRRGFGVVKVKVLSLGADSLCESVPVIWVEVREWFLIKPLKSMAYLRTNRASFCVALGSKGDCTAAVWRLVIRQPHAALCGRKVIFQEAAAARQFPLFASTLSNSKRHAKLKTKD